MRAVSARRAEPQHALLVQKGPLDGNGYVTKAMMSVMGCLSENAWGGIEAPRHAHPLNRD